MGSPVPIALLTDFGLKDPFVGIMKAVILGINPSATIIDLGHEFRAGDVRSASFALWMAWSYLPEGTVVAAVVDPGVGTDRRAIAARVGGRLFVGPDNGLISWVGHAWKPETTVAITNARFFLPEVSNTFHGRDVFAPVAAHLSRGVQIEDLGEPVRDPIVFPIPEVSVGDRSIRGEVVYIDRFGNLVTNITERCFRQQSTLTPETTKLHIGSVEIDGISRSYAGVPKGHALAIFGSAGLLEIAVNGGNASSSLGASVGTSVLLY